MIWKIDLRKAGKEIKETIRKTAIRMLNEGKIKKEVIEVLGVNKNSVASWDKKYRKNSLKGLKDKPAGKKYGEHRLLTPSQELQIQKQITDKMPDQLKLPFALWTRQAIKKAIEQEFGVKIALNHKRLSLNMISTVTNQGLIRFMTYQGSMTSNVFIKFLRRLVKSEKQKIYLILDNLKVHHSKPFKEWVDKHIDKLSLFFLPSYSYSPECNPDEYLNGDLKYDISQKPMPKNQTKIKS